MAELRRARNDLARRLHPDAGGASSAAMAAVNAAYEAAVAACVEEAVFGFDVLPVEAFHAVVVAVTAVGAGEVLDADEPYALDGYVTEPWPCFVRVELVPEAGGTIATLAVSAAEGVAPPPAAAVLRALFGQ